MIKLGFFYVSFRSDVSLRMLAAEQLVDPLASGLIIVPPRPLELLLHPL